MVIKDPVDNKGMVPVRAGVVGEALRAVLTCLILLMNLLGEPLAAFDGEAGLQGTWTDNLYLTASSVEDFVTTPFGYAETNIGGDFGLWYRVNGYSYSNNSELNALWQRAAVRYNANNDGKREIEVELGYSGILHVTDTKDLDHHQLGGTLDLNLRPSPNMLVRPGIAGYFRMYPNRQSLNYVEGIGNILMNRSFATKTTLRLGGTVYFREFLEPMSQELVIQPLTSQEITRALSLATPLTSGGNSLGPGGHGYGPAGPGGGQGPGRGSGSQGPPPGVAVEGNLTSRSTGQLLLALRLAQSLHSRACILVEGTYRLNFLDPPRYAEGSLPSVESEFFDDHYGYEGPGATMQFTLLLPLSTRLVLKGLMEERHYVGREALDINGNPKDPAGQNRRDERYEITVRGEFSREFERTFPTGISVDVGYVRAWNVSNDDWYDTSEHRVFASTSLLW